MSEHTTVETVGRKSGRIVRLRYEYDPERDAPKIDIVDSDNYPASMCDIWLFDLDVLTQRPMEFRGLDLRITDPVRVLVAMEAFYDEPPKETIEDPDGFFACDPDKIY